MSFRLVKNDSRIMEIQKDIITIDDPMITSKTWIDALIRARPAHVIDEAKILPSFSNTVIKMSICDFGYKCWKKKKLIINHVSKTDSSETLDDYLSFLKLRYLPYKLLTQVLLLMLSPFLFLLNHQHYYQELFFVAMQREHDWS